MAERKIPVSKKKYTDKKTVSGGPTGCFLMKLYKTHA